MSHITGTVQTQSPALLIGPDSGAVPTAPNTWALNFAHAPAPGGTKLLILHFQNVSLPAANRLEVDLGYGTDVFTPAEGPSFWTRPVNVYAVAGGLVPIPNITNGAASGGVQLDRYGRGERHAGEPGHPSISNCDPFLGDATYVEPTRRSAYKLDHLRLPDRRCGQPARRLQRALLQSQGGPQPPLRRETIIPTLRAIRARTSPGTETRATFSQLGGPTPNQNGSYGRDQRTVKLSCLWWQLLDSTPRIRHRSRE